MDSKILKKRLKHFMADKDLNYSDVERGSGLPRTTLTNFVSGKTKTLKLDSILAIAKFLEIKLDDLVTEPLRIENHISAINNIHSSSVEGLLFNKHLFSECSQYLVSFVEKNHLSISFEDAISVLRRSYEYSMRYSNGKLDESFLEFSLLDLSKQ